VFITQNINYYNNNNTNVIFKVLKLALNIEIVVKF
jgi:hypothetical protein